MKLKQIRDFVENYTDLDIGVHSRKRNVVDTRAIYFYLCRKHTNLSTQVIGESLGLHHSSVLHSVKKIAPVVIKINQSLANLCKNFSKIHKEALKNTTVSREKLLEENVRLKSELSSYKSNKLIELVKDIPKESIDFVFDRIVLTTSIINQGVEEDKEIYEEC
jgi:L-cysteine desulfidase